MAAWRTFWVSRLHMAMQSTRETQNDYAAARVVNCLWHSVSRLKRRRRFSPHSTLLDQTMSNFAQREDCRYRIRTKMHTYCIPNHKVMYYNHLHVIEIIDLLCNLMYVSEREIEIVSLSQSEPHRVVQQVRVTCCQVQLTCKNYSCTLTPLLFVTKFLLIEIPDMFSVIIGFSACNFDRDMIHETSQV